MIPKKTKKADLENKRFIFFQIGLIVSLAVALLAFEWGTGDPKKSVILRSGNDEPDGEPLINTYMKEEIPPVIKPYDYYDFDIKNNDEDLINQAIDIDIEIDPWEGVDIPNVPEKTDEDIPFVIVSEMPSFMNGGLSDFVNYIQSNVVYHKDAIKMGIQGRVFAEFVVNKEGYIEQIRIVRGVDPLLDNAVLKALKASPRWKPGKQRDIPVKVIYTIPVVFKINY
jgi:protein TonB